MPAEDISILLLLLLTFCWNEQKICLELLQQLRKQQQQQLSHLSRLLLKLQISAWLALQDCAKNRRIICCTLGQTTYIHTKGDQLSILILKQLRKKQNE